MAGDAEMSWCRRGFIYSWRRGLILGNWNLCIRVLSVRPRTVESSKPSWRPSPGPGPLDKTLCPLSPAHRAGSPHHRPARPLDCRPATVRLPFPSIEARCARRRRRPLLPSAMSDQATSPVRRNSKTDDNGNARQKRRYGASCEACRRRKRYVLVPPSPAVPSRDVPPGAATAKALMGAPSANIAHKPASPASSLRAHPPKKYTQTDY